MPSQDLLLLCRPQVDQWFTSASFPIRAGHLAHFTAAALYSNDDYRIGVLCMVRIRRFTSPRSIRRLGRPGSTPP